MKSGMNHPVFGFQECFPLEQGLENICALFGNKVGLFLDKIADLVVANVTASRYCIGIFELENSKKVDVSLNTKMGTKQRNLTARKSGE